MSQNIKTFGEIAKGLARSPLTIIALFLVLEIALVLSFPSSLGPFERQMLIAFLVVFPVLLLGVFVYLVSRHPGKLYSPADFKDETNFLRMVLPAAVSVVPVSDADETDLKQKIARSGAAASGKEPLAVTAILFPRVVYTGDGNLDTGVAIANAAADPPVIGTRGQIGDVTIYFWRADGGPNPAPLKIATNLKPGQTATFVLSQLVSPFAGYAIAICGFQHGHGYASIISPANKGMHGYLGTIITDRIH